MLKIVYQYTIFILSFIAGCIAVLSFAPFSVYPLSIVAFALLLFSWIKLNGKPWQTFLSGWLFGLGFFGFGVSWVYISLNTYGNAPSLFAALLTLLFVSFLALFPALNGYLFNKLFPSNNLPKMLMFFPASVVLLEFLRSFIFTGFPWLFAGYSQINSPLKNIAPIFGVYGVSFAVFLTSAAIVGFFLTKKKFFKLLILLMVIFLWVGSYCLHNVKWTTPKGESIRVSLVQGNIPLEDKWDEKKANSIMQDYYDLSFSDETTGQIIVWPEGAIPLLQWQIPKALKNIAKDARKFKTTIVTGIIYQPIGSDKYYNGMIALGESDSLYLKKRLVPFGEFLPFKPLLSWLLNFLYIPWSDFSSGDYKQKDFIAGNLSIAPFICYEIAYPLMSLGYFPKAELLLNISENAWFGHSIASSQQLEMARMRSLETGRYQIVCTNSGMTAIIDSSGNLEAIAPDFQQLVLNGEIKPMTGNTPWVDYGHYLWLLLLLNLLGFSLVFRLSSGKTS